MVRITRRVATTSLKSAIETPEQHYVEFAQKRALCDPEFPVYEQNRISNIPCFIYEKIRIRESSYISIFHVVQDVKYVQS